MQLALSAGLTSSNTEKDIVHFFSALKSEILHLKAASENLNSENSNLESRLKDMQSKLSSCREDLVKSKDTIATLEIRNKLLTEKIVIAESSLQEIVSTKDDKYEELARQNEILRAELYDSQNAVDRLNVDKEKLQEDFFQSHDATKNSFEKEIMIKVSELEALKVI